MYVHSIAGDVVMFHGMRRCHAAVKRIKGMAGDTVAFVPPGLPRVGPVQHIKV